MQQRERPCTCCDTLTLACVMVDASERSAFLGLVCPQCDEDLTAEEHAEDGEHCVCETCVRARTRAEHVSVQRFGVSAGGLRAAQLLDLTVFLED